MERRILNQGQEITYQLKRSRKRRTLALQIDPTGTVTVYAPHYAWHYFIDRFVRKHADWVKQKLLLFKERLEKYPPRPRLSETLRAEWTGKTQSRLPAVIARYSEALGVKPRSVKVANQRSRWGSCSARGNVRFSWRIAEFPDRVFDYIVVHELAHLKEMNHGSRFWALVADQIPDHKTHRRWLKNEAPY